MDKKKLLYEEREFGLEYRNNKTYGNVIVFETIRDKVVALMDKSNYHIFYIGTIENMIREDEIESWVMQKYNDYATRKINITNCETNTKLNMVSVKDILDLVFKTEKSIEEGNSVCLNFLEDNRWLKENVLGLLGHYRFLNFKIEEYLKLSNKLQVLGLSMPDVQSYLLCLIDTISKEVEKDILAGRNIDSMRFNNILVNHNKTFNDYCFDNTVDLFMAIRGYKYRGNKVLELDKNFDLDEVFFNFLQMFGDEKQIIVDNLVCDDEQILKLEKVD